MQERILAPDDFVRRKEADGLDGMIDRHEVMKREDGGRLVVTRSPKRARRDSRLRGRAIQRLRKHLDAGGRRASLANRGHARFTNGRGGEKVAGHIHGSPGLRWNTAWCPIRQRRRKPAGIR